MNKVEALRIINDNSKSTNKSLLEFTHEKQEFNLVAYWEFYNAIRVLGYQYSAKKELEREITSKIIKSYQYFLLEIGFHFDEIDLYEMDKMPKNYTDFSFRLKHVIDAYLIGCPVLDEDEYSLNVDLKNLNTLKLDK